MSFIEGIWLHESGVLAASPDGIVTKPVALEHTTPTAGPILLEVKCPFAAKDMTNAEAVVLLKNFYLSEFHIVLYINNNYHFLPI